MEFYRPPALQETLEAFGSIYRALRAWKFYPKGHPIRKASVRLAHANMLRTLDGNVLSLACGRSGFSFPDGEKIKDVTNLSAALSQEFFVRRVQKLIFLADLNEEDLFDLVRILSLPPELVFSSGGLARIMADHGVRTIWANEFDLTVIRMRRKEIEAKGVLPPGLDEIENGLPEAPTAADVPDPEPTAVVDDLATLLNKLRGTQNEGVYLSLVRKALDIADGFISRHEFLQALPLVELLAEHAIDAAREPGLSGSARFGLEHLATADDLLIFVLEGLDSADGLSKPAALALLQSAGPAAITLTVEKLGTIESLPKRKAITTLLVKLGAPAVPAILTMMSDKRWFIVRNLAAILGDIGCVEAVPGLQGCLSHHDMRVSKEAIRSLAKIGGTEAETAILSVLSEKNPLLMPQAITSLGALKSRRALSILMQILYEEDLFLKNLPLKLEAVGAIAMIGDRSVVPSLIELLDSKHLMARNRWLQLKSAVARALGKIGDMRALTALQKHLSAPAELGQACREAMDAIQRYQEAIDQ